MSSNSHQFIAAQLQSGANRMTEVQAELRKLDILKDTLSRTLYRLDSLEHKDSIFQLLAQYRDELDSLRNELEFVYGFDLSRGVQGGTDGVLEQIVQFDSFKEFLGLCEAGFVNKQLELRNDVLTRFEDLKRSKYTRESVTKDDDAGDNNGSPQVEPVISQDAKIMNTTRRITSKLHQSSQVLQSSLMQSHLNLEELEIQGDSLARFADRNDFVGGVLTRSEGFINDIRLSSVRDKKRMYYAIGFFGVCVAKVFWGRVFKWPVLLSWRVFWYFLRMCMSFVFPGVGNGVVEESVKIIAPELTMSESLRLVTQSLTQSLTESLTESLSDALSDGPKTTTEALEEALGRIIDEL